jgi:[ribosomal protein S5]-alanine N-acetyltransferase
MAAAPASTEGKAPAPRPGDVLWEPIRTERLVLHPFSANWVESLRDYQIRNAAHLQPWEPRRAANFFEPEVFARHAQSWLAAVQAGAALRWVLVLNSPDQQRRVVGIANFSQMVPPPMQACNLGYSIDASLAGQKLMQEALRALIQPVSERLQLHRIQANHVPHNLASAAVLKALGFEREGLAKAYLQIDGRWQDHVMTAWTNPAIAPKALG